MSSEGQAQRRQPRPVFPFRFEDVVVGVTNKQSLSQIPGVDQQNPGKILSEKLNKMSLEERTQGIHELHGVDETSGESPENIQRRLKEIDTIVRTFADSDTEAYRLAVEMDRDYVEGIKLLCLKADYYDSAKAAARLVSFFAFKESSFGKEKLARDITLGDLHGEDLATLQAGAQHLLQQRDRVGRGILFVVGKRSALGSSPSLFRVFFYLIMLALRDEAIQEKGLVYIFYALGQKTFLRDRPNKLNRTMGYLPIRVVAVHFCYDSPMLSVLLSLFSRTMEGHHVCRFRHHNGTYLECIYELMTYGIPSHVLPLSMETGEIDLQSLHQWLETQKRREEQLEMEKKNRQNENMAAALDGTTVPTNTTSSNGSGEIVVPGPLDIVSGRGRTSPGSARLQMLIENYSDAYDKGDRFDKSVIRDTILQDLRDRGCRFVQLSPEGWLEESEDVCRAKVSMAIRNRRKKQRKATKTQQQNKRGLSGPS